MKLNSIHHIAIICSDYQKSKDFYTRILGFKIISETYRAERGSYKLDLQINKDVQLELFSFPKPPHRKTEPEACGLRHFAFKVKDILATKNELEKLGIPVEDIRIDTITEKKYTFFKDPDGLPLELYEE